MTEPSAYGKFYWCVRIPQLLGEEAGETEQLEGTLVAPAEIYLYADECVSHASGAIEFTRIRKDEATGELVRHINMVLAAGEWICAYQADIDDGHALAVEA